MTEAGVHQLLGRDVSRETMAKLAELEGLVQRWSPVINLVSRSSLADLWGRHIADSAQLMGFCPPQARFWADVGSGGGFPGLVVAILAAEERPDLRFALVESDQRKATFLRQAASGLNLPVEVIAERVESLADLGADVLSARALAPLTDLLGLAASHLARNGVAIFPKGRQHFAEIADAQKSWLFDVERYPSLSDGAAAILVIRNIRRAH
jgi:16S rRNA (guanine527-N7)-methyltransferase